MKSKILDLIRGAPATAEALSKAITEAERERAAADRREQELAIARSEALISGDDDAEVDRIERELAAVQRDIERHDFRLPELRRRHALQIERDEREADTAAFERALDQRMTAIAEIERALGEFHEAVSAYRATGVDLERLHRHHGASVGPDGANPIERLSPAMLMVAIWESAPTVAKLLGVTRQTREEGKTLSIIEAEYWAAIRRRMAARAAQTEGARDG